MALHLHRAPRTDELADGLGALLAEPLADPFAEEVVAVPAAGVERWLTQRLSHRLGTGPRGEDGVCAGVRFLAPSSLVALLLGIEHDDPWHPDRLAWPLLRTIDASLDEPWCQVLAAHLGHGPAADQTSEEAALRRGRRYAVARRLAGLFASYADQRPSLVREWRHGGNGDGLGGDLDGDLAWQPELWRRLLARVPARPPDVRHDEAVARLETGDPALPLPGRLSLFGHTRLSVSDVALLRALGRQREVHLWLPQPSPALWETLTDVGGPVPRQDDRSAARAAHPLLASLGRDTRELARTLHGVADHENTPGTTTTPAPEQPGTLLGWLQHDLRHDTVPDEEVRAARTPAPGDRSVQVHACHGPARQVEVLRDVLTGLLQDDPTLEPRDIVVMCPDVETYAPLISAAFGLAGDGDEVPDDGFHPAHRLRVRLADRAPGASNPLLATALTLVDLAGSRCTSGEVRDLAASEPVRRRFRWSEDDLTRIDDWVRDSGVRWGIDAAGRQEYALGGFAQNTWRSGLDRLLLGAVMSGDGDPHVGSAVPLDDVPGSDLDRVGALAELVHRLGDTLRALERAQTVGDWVDALSLGVRRLTEVPPEQAWQRAQFDREMARVRDDAGRAGSPDGDAAPGPAGEQEPDEERVALGRSDVRALLRSRLAGRPTRANFRTGTLTVCTMVPMRSVPHRVVCLLGVDDGVFPRTPVADGDDVLARQPVTGERDARSEDRQLLLDAVLAAEETLVVTYTGANEQSGTPRPPAVPVAELLDALAGTAATAVRDPDGGVVTHHPLQVYDPRNLTPGGLGGQEPFSFDTAALAGARAAHGPRVEPGPFLAAPLPAAPTDDVSLAELHEFLQRPVRHFLRQRLEVGTPALAEEEPDGIPVELDGLGRWQIGERLLRAVEEGQDVSAFLTAEQLRDTLPPGRLGSQVLHQVSEQARQVYLAARPDRESPARTVDVDVDLGGGRRLTGTVTGVHGTRVVRSSYSRLSARLRLASWVDVLALSAHDPDRNWTGSAVGRGRTGARRALCGPVDHRATDWLADLVALYDQGLREPLPVPLKTGLAWAEQYARELQGDPTEAAATARREWETDPYSPHGITGEDDDAAHARVFGPRAPLETLLRAGLGQYAWRIWAPLVTGHERVQ